MGSKNKLKRFKENQTFTNVIQPDREKIIEENLFLKGKFMIIRLGSKKYYLTVLK